MFVDLLLPPSRSSPALRRVPLRGEAGRADVEVHGDAERAGQDVVRAAALHQQDHGQARQQGERLQVRNSRIKEIRSLVNLIQYSPSRSPLAFIKNERFLLPF